MLNLHLCVCATHADARVACLCDPRLLAAWRDSCHMYARSQAAAPSRYHRHDHPAVGAIYIQAYIRIIREDFDLSLTPIPIESPLNSNSVQFDENSKLYLWSWNKVHNNFQYAIVSNILVITTVLVLHMRTVLLSLIADRATPSSPFCGMTAVSFC